MRALQHAIHAATEMVSAAACSMADSEPSSEVFDATVVAAAVQHPIADAVQLPLAVAKPDHAILLR